MLEGPLQEVWALEGGRAHLPCNITAPTPEDTPILVLFYNGVTGTPVYRSLGTRAHFDATSLPQGLVVDDLSMADEGQYRCRVDFKASPTRNLRVALTVVGSPAPRVTWWDEGTLLDNVVEAGVERGGGEGRGVTTRVITNTLTLPRLSRQHLYRVLTCQAANSNLTLPVAATVTLDLTFPPLEVKILGGRGALSAGNRYSLVCEAGGSRPRPRSPGGLTERWSRTRKTRFFRRATSAGPQFTWRHTEGSTGPLLRAELKMLYWMVLYLKTPRN
ncbi:hypothetical protein O3P69_019351 [Scylla paramamosain]|uniref:Ig-like domain-containing protein n=1 Tax=Scylla paramamosain TaxID=85552 RepID=A0AAW0SWD2_SCYPA